MVSTPQLTIFRRFTNLNKQNRLYYQAELFYLEGQLRQLETDGSRSSDSGPKSRFARDWEWLNAVDLNGGANHQMKIVLRICTVIKEYSELVSTNGAQK